MAPNGRPTGTFWRNVDDGLPQLAANEVKPGASALHRICDSACPGGFQIAERASNAAAKSLVADEP